MQIGNYDITLDDMAYLSKPMRWLIIGVILFVVLVLVYCLDTRVQFAEIAQAKQQQTQLKTKLSNDYRQIAYANVYQQQIQQMQQSLNAFIDSLPDQTELPSLLETISTLAQQNQVIVKQVQAGTAIEQPFYLVLPITVKAIGSYHQLANFMAALQGLSDILVIDNLQMQLITPGTANKAELLNMQAIVNAYRHQQVSKRLLGSDR